MNSSEPAYGDPFLAELIDTIRGDLHTLGLLLHGSRSVGRHRADSDYDLIRIVTAEAYEARRAAGALIEKLTPNGTHKVDVLYQTPSRIEPYVTEPSWYTPTYLSAQILFDRTGEISRAPWLDSRQRQAGSARERLAANYDDYLNSFVRSMKAARHGDELGRRLHRGGIGRCAHPDALRAPVEVAAVSRRPDCPPSSARDCARLAAGLPVGRPSPAGSGWRSDVPAAGGGARRAADDRTRDRARVGRRRSSSR